MHREQRADTVQGVSRKTESRDGLIHVPHRLRADDDLCHSGQLVERGTFPAFCLGKPLLGALPRAWNRVEDFRYATGVRIGVIERGREKPQRPSD
jgi:hypothetical protein